MSEEINKMNAELTQEQEQEGQTSVERCLTFESSDILMFISTKYVIEIINDYPITPLPLIPSSVKGIINLRGQILPVVDIRLSMGQPQLDYTNKTCIIVLNIDSIPLGIVVDSVRQVVDIDLGRVRPIPVKRQQKLLDGMVTMDDGRVIMAFDCASLVS